LQKKDIHRSASTLTDAFRHDPAWNTVFADATMPQRAYVFEVPVRYCIRYGEVYAPSEALEGVAAWMPGKLANMTLWRSLRCGALWSGMKVGTKIVMRMKPVFRPIELDRKACISHLASS
jgi:hypothetical protein